MPKLFDVTILGTIKAKVCKVSAEGMREAVVKAKEEYDVEILNDALPEIPGIKLKIADHDEPSYAVEAAGNGDKRHPDPAIVFARSGDDRLVKIPSGILPNLADMCQFIQRISSLKTEEEQYVDGDEFSNSEHVSNMNQVITEAREMLGKTDSHGANTSW